VKGKKWGAKSGFGAGSWKMGAPSASVQVKWAASLVGFLFSLAAICLLTSLAHAQEWPQSEAARPPLRSAAEVRKTTASNLSSTAQDKPSSSPLGVGLDSKQSKRTDGTSTAMVSGAGPLPAGSLSNL